MIVTCRDLGRIPLEQARQMRNLAQTESCGATLEGMSLPLDTLTVGFDREFLQQFQAIVRLFDEYCQRLGRCFFSDLRGYILKALRSIAEALSVDGTAAGTNGGAMTAESVSTTAAALHSTRKIALTIAALRTGLTTRSFMPASRHAATSSANALAGKAIRHMLRLALTSPNSPRCLQAVHFRHANIHQNKVIVEGGSGCHCFDSVACNTRVDLELLEHIGGDQAVRWIVIDDQYPKRPAERRDPRLEFGVDNLIVVLRHSHLVSDRKRQSEVKDRALPRRRIYFDFATHLFDQPLADCKSEPRAAEASTDRVARA